MKDKNIKLTVTCPTCQGMGKIYLGERDPIEGNKMRDIDVCNLCRGSGWIEVETSAQEALAKAVSAISEPETMQEQVEKLVKKEVTAILNGWKKTL